MHYGDRRRSRLDGRELTYTQLAAPGGRRDARSLARHVAPGDRVALWFNNSFNWLACFLAVNALGGVLGADQHAPDRRRARGDPAPMPACACSSCVPSYRGRNYLDEARSRWRRWSPKAVVSTPPNAPACEWQTSRWRGAACTRSRWRDGVLCIQYTSGTTALPKGAMLTSRLHPRRDLRGALPAPHPGSRFISAAPFFHCSGSMHAMTTCLLAGCTLNSMSAWDPEYFLRLVERHRGDTGTWIYFRDVLALGAAKARDAACDDEGR